jgi:hypothetical protein
MHLLLALVAAWPAPAASTEPARTSLAAPAAVVATSEAAADSLYRQLDLSGKLDRDAFVAGYLRVEQRGTVGGILAIADMSKPSTERRLSIIDLDAKRVLLTTWVAHGQNSGGLTATEFSNRPESHQTSLGLYRVGARITSPKHGPALLLHGLDRGINDNALARELIIHGADYVSESFIERNGRLGRSWGCPAVPRAEMGLVIDYLADGGLLYVHG